MKASELRIGNYMNVDGNVFTVDSLVSVNGHIEVYFKENDCYDHSLNAEPIPLTQQWFLDFGATPFPSGGLKLNGQLFSHMECRDVWVSMSTNVEVQFVHKLQNLMYELTLKELTKKNSISNK